MKTLLIGLTLALCAGCVSAKEAVETKKVFTLPEGVEVSFVEAIFLKSQFKVDGCNELGTECRINGHTPYGVESSIPLTYMKGLSITFQGKTFMLDATDMYNAWGSRPLEHKGAIRYFGGGCLDEQNCQFRGIFSDGANTFAAEWRITNGLPARTVLTTSNDVIDLFIKHIDPPMIGRD